MVGHGLRDHLVLGIVELDHEPVEVLVRIRRYRCLACNAVCEVVPAGLASGHHYTWSTVCLALALWGLSGLPALAIRRDLSPFHHLGASVVGWASLRRWARRHGVGGGTLRERAARFARTLLAQSRLSATEYGIEPRIFDASLQPG